MHTIIYGGTTDLTEHENLEYLKFLQINKNFLSAF